MNLFLPANFTNFDENVTTTIATTTSTAKYVEHDDNELFYILIIGFTLMAIFACLIQTVNCLGKMREYSGGRCCGFFCNFFKYLLCYKRKLKALPEYEFSTKSRKNLYSCCVLCVSEYREKDVLLTLPCCHYFHSDCIRRYLVANSGLCPICKQHVFNYNWSPVNQDFDKSNFYGSVQI